MNTHFTHHSLSIPANGVRSLRWSGEHLVDWLLGVRWALDGTSERVAPEADDSFDALVASVSSAPRLPRAQASARTAATASAPDRAETSANDIDPSLTSPETIA